LVNYMVRQLGIQLVNYTVRRLGIRLGVR
jgi:hypothetical protein